MTPQRESLLSRTGLLHLLITFAAYSTTGVAGIVWLDTISSRQQGNTSASLSVVWLAPGAAIICSYLYGRRMWPAVFAGSVFVWGIYRGTYLPVNLAESVGEALSIALIVTLLRRWGFRPTFERYVDSLILFAAVAIGRTVTSGVDALCVLVAASLATEPKLVAALTAAGAMRGAGGLVITPALLHFAVRWWANTAAGSSLVTPLLALWFSPPTLSRPRGVAEFVAFALACVGWIVIAFSVAPGSGWPGLLLGAFALVATAVIRLGVGIAMLTTLVLALASSFGFGLQRGTFGGLDVSERVKSAWAFTGLLVATAVFLTALLAQRAHARRAIRASLQRYQRLFDANPYPVWIEDAGTGRILLANPAAARTYGYSTAEFLGRQGPGLSVGADGAAPQPAAANALAVAIERHRTREGAEFEVEIRRRTAVLDGAAVRICFVEPLAERNELRLAALNAGDIERFRMSEVISRQLVPILGTIARTTERLGGSPEPGDPSQEALLAEIDAGIDAAGTICSRLTRGASPLQWADGDLAKALYRLPSTLPEPGPPVVVSILTDEWKSLPIEARDHAYRMAEEAVHAAAARPSVSLVRVTLDTHAGAARILVEDDGSAPGPVNRSEDDALRSIGARAVAAKALLQVGQSRTGGRAVSLEFERQSDRPQPLAEPPPRPAATRGPAAPSDIDWGARKYRLIIGLALVLVGMAVAPLLDAILRTQSDEFWFGPTLTLPYAPHGIAVAALLIGGWRLVPILAVVSFALGVITEARPMVVLIDTVSLLAAWAATVRVLQWSGFQNACDRLYDILALGLAAVVGQSLKVVLYLSGTVLLWRLHPQSAPELQTAGAGGLVALVHYLLQGTWSWWVAGVSGILLVVPAIISWSRATWALLLARRTEALAWSAAVGGVIVAIMTAPDAQLHLAIVAAALVVTVWAAVRLGTPLAWTAVTLVVVAATLTTVGHDAAMPAAERARINEAMWAFVALLAVMAQLLTTLIAESARTERELRGAEARYRFLFDGVPHPLFGVASSDHRIRVANVAACERYGYAEDEFRSMTLGDLEGGGARGPRGPSTDAPSVYARRHRTRSGAVLDVEFVVVPVMFGDEAGTLCFAIDITEHSQLRSQLIETSDRARRRLAREFHDGLGQILTGLRLGVRALAHCRERGEPMQPASIKFATRAAQEAVRACGGILRGLSPLHETGGDLAEALRLLPHRLPPDARIQIDVVTTGVGATPLPLQVSEHLYQFAQEATNNAIKHAQASRISIVLDVTPEEVALRVEDDGRGFDPRRVTSGIGLESLQLRARSIGGRMRVYAGAIRGAVLEIRCPPARPVDPVEA